ncbi:hypothetical protein CF302_08560 [Klebsiella pneumoniae]|uniref:hypothetical protein n=1 Tax=Klebsiella pneumoniae TaxID=573 RepID=UPI00044DC526|nr:hypothetical protein [Klebsiella pneumoniae]EIW8556138.1 hypothetical protein [Klebsiella pneumoniae]EIW8594483.1 hypothetical protein [Klebsiella pneumoniae]EIW8728770.1 hypothetical protein [Klebsiella pneumoniae]EWE61674.1 hypothetical protein L451_06026 [Klebsiella pneumoniae BIDMC 18D]PLL34274.1 hypothetical protein CWN15_10715 [Klebsiella pneumoniae]
MNIETVNELIASLESAGELSIREQKFLKLAKEFRICSASLDAAIKTGNMLADQNAQLAAENAALKSNLMFWDADNPEFPYDSPEEIASECSLNYNEEFVVQVAAKLPNRTYRVCESWESDCKLELVEGADLKTPATDRIVAEAEARGVEKAIAHLEKKFSNIGVQIMNLQWLAGSLRDGDGK